MTQHQVDNIQHTYESLKTFYDGFLRMAKECDHLFPKGISAVDTDEMYASKCRLCRRRIQWFDGRWTAVGEPKL